ncbi:MAG: diphthamide biosynthesis enzyme Dph2 [Candidatus Bathyarchaeota archaeon]|nr:diphthamide biosynthesis enzyme Dph2 [Candidatus Bathyarchaeota archaeon A05DMB-5]MDH7557294.1 diphthamide biosynthesis enzyme Dph2 [Candidatus Bathyarchaeota archaeon]
MKQFDFEEERVKQEILKLGAKRVLIQLPEGLKPEAPRLAKTIEKFGALPIISADPCYGACDLATAEAETLCVDLIIHYGHSKLLKYERVPTIYVEARATINVDGAVEKALPLMEKWRKIGLTTTVQHVQTLDSVREILLHAGKIVVIGDAGRVNYPGQVIGCDYSNAKSIAKDVEAFLFVGGGRFHALGVALSTSKPTIVADPYENRAYPIDEQAAKILKQRWASMEEARKAKSTAVLIGLKPGQRRFDEALSLKRKLEENGKTAFLFVVREVTPEVLMEFPTVDAYVNTACPRVSLDDASKFPKPVLTINEARVVVGELSWEELCRKGLFEN